MSDYSKLKNYVSESKNGTSSSGSSDTAKSLNNAKDSVLNFFNKNVLRNDLRSGNTDLKGSDEQSDNWFKDAESDPFCPKLVTFMSYFCFKSRFNLTFFFLIHRAKNRELLVLCFAF